RVKEVMLEPLREAGFSWLALGIEAGSARVRADVDKRFDQQEVFEVVSNVRAAGINVIGNYIFGLPEDDAETMRATLDLAEELNCEFANFYSAMAYPGSPLYDLAVRRGVPLPAAWTGYSPHSRDCLPLPPRHVPAYEVLRFRDEAFIHYYTNPHYLEMIGHRFGPAVVGQVRRMTAHSLERDLLSGKLEAPATLLPPEDAGPPGRRPLLRIGLDQERAREQNLSSLNGDATRDGTTMQGRVLVTRGLGYLGSTLGARLPTTVF